MTRRKITIEFDTRLDVDKRIYNALNKIKGSAGDKNNSQTLIKFLDQLALHASRLEEALSKCDQKNGLCLKVLKDFTGKDMSELDLINSQRLTNFRRDN